PRDCQSKTGAAMRRVRPWPRVDLLKFLKHPLLVCNRNSNPGIDHLDSEPRADVLLSTGSELRESFGQSIFPRQHTSLHNDRAGIRVLDRVSDEIHKDLTQMSRIGPNSGQCAAHYERKAQAFFVEEGLYFTRDVENKGSYVE